MNYNPSATGLNNGHIFGLPHSFNDSELIILPVPWELTASFGKGCANAPMQILEASRQLDLYHFDFPEIWKKGIYMLEISANLQQSERLLKNKANEIKLLLEKGVELSALQPALDEINIACGELNHFVFEQAEKLLATGKKVIVLGGDHSTPFGYLQSLSKRHSSFGILQIDAHADLRKAYQGFEHSHASAMHNALQLDAVSHLTSVAVRDLCKEEIDYIEEHDNIKLYNDLQLSKNQFSGKNWADQIKEIVATLPKHVYISFDIDGLSPELCPATGTPVPGGLSYHQALELIKEVHRQDKTIIGADLVEVGNAKFDANVGARVLYELSCLMLMQS